MVDINKLKELARLAKRELAEHIKHIVAAGQDDVGDENPIDVYLPSLRVILPKWRLGRGSCPNPR